MASLTGKLASQTYDSLLKTLGNLPLDGTLREITDGFGNSAKISIDTNGNMKLEGNLEAVGNILKSGGTSVQFLKADGTVDNTVYQALLTAGTGVSLINDTIANTSPDQVVAITGGTNVTVSGTYPNFAIAFSGGGGGGDVDSVNGKTGTVVLVTDDISDTGETNKWNIDHTGDVTGATALTIKPLGVTNAKIATSAVTSGKLAADAVITAKIKDGAVTAAKLSTALNAPVTSVNTLTGDVVLKTDNISATSETNQWNVDHTGEVTGATDLTIADEAVTTAKIADGAVTAAKLAGGTTAPVSSVNTKVGAVVLATDDISDTGETNKWNVDHTGEVTGATDLTIADDAVTTAKIADAAVDTLQLADGSVTSVKLSSALAAPVTSVNTKTGAVTLVTDDISDISETNKWNIAHTSEVTGATALTITDGAVVTDRLGDLAVTTAKIAANAITTAKIAVDTIVYADLGVEFKAAVGVANTLNFNLATQFTATISSGNTRAFVFSNTKIGDVKTLLVTGDGTITFPTGSTIVAGTYDGAKVNFIQIVVTGSNQFWLSISN